MSFYSQFFEFLRDSQESIVRFAPELALCGTIVALLLMRMLAKRLESFVVAFVGVAIALVYAAPWNHLTDGRQELFTGLLVYDGLGVFIRAALLFFVLLFLVFTRLSGIPGREDACDVYSLVIGSAVGMCLMTTANHLFVAFMAVEMASVPSYALAGLLKGRRQSSEAALKYAVYGAGTAGVMLYGISLLVGLTNSAHLPTVATTLAMKLPSMAPSELMVLSLGGLMLTVGLAFKLSAVPFHFWCPDVFEGASAEVNAFLSVASKAAALGLLVRIAVGLTLIPAAAPLPGPAHATLRAPLPGVVVAYRAGEPLAAAEGKGAPSDATLNAHLAPMRSFAARLIALLAIASCTFGNLAAYGQTNIKRMLAYSTIAHAGYMMMPIPAALMLAQSDPAEARTAIASLGIYIGVYLFMNLGAFVVVAFLRNAIRSEEIADYAGLVRRLPLLTVCMAMILFALVGLPPLSGFIGKFAVFASLVDAFRKTNEGFLLFLLVAGGLNTAVSLFYYLRVVKVMTIDAEPADRVPFEFSDVSPTGAFVWLVTAPTVLLFVFWSWLSVWANWAAQSMFV